METKVCSKCWVEKPATKEFWYIRCDKYFSTMCRICHCNYTKEYKKKCSKDIIVKYNKSAYEKGKIKYLERSKKYKKINRLKINIKANEYSKRECKNLVDSYVFRLLKARGFSKEDITPELMEVQRLLTQTQRLCKTSPNSETV